MATTTKWKKVPGKLNTYRRVKNGVTQIKYYSTIIMEVFPDGRVTIRDGGWSTPSTKRRINYFLEEFGVQGKVFQKDFDWYFYRHGKEVPFNGEITFIKYCLNTVRIPADQQP